jgi:DNA-binding NtrC family response regulator
MNKPTIRILLIEDNEGDVRLMREWLAESQRVEFELLWAQTLKEAIEKLKIESLAAALVDLSLPDSHGIDTFDRVYRAKAGLPIIVLTGQDDEAMAVEAVQKGAQDYLVKQHLSSSHLLIHAIRHAIERKQLIVELNQRVRELQNKLLDARRASFEEPYCSSCQGLEKNQPFWLQLEQYLQQHATAARAGSVCTRCYEQMLRHKLDDFRINRLQIFHR